MHCSRCSALHLGCRDKRKRGGFSRNGNKLTDVGRILLHALACCDDFLAPYQFEMFDLDHVTAEDWMIGFEQSTCVQGTLYSV